MQLLMVVKSVTVRAEREWQSLEEVIPVPLLLGLARMRWRPRSSPCRREGERFGGCVTALREASAF